MFKMYQKDNLKLFVGVVEGDPIRIERDDGLIVMITLKDYQNERIKIYFRNNRTTRQEMRADRIINAKVCDGTFLTVLATCSDPKEESATGLDFKFRGCWKFKTEGDKYTSVIMGVACRPRAPADGMFCITIPLDEYENGKIVTKWIDVSFYDTDGKGEARKCAAFASRVLHGTDRPWVAVCGGSIKTSEYKDKLVYSMIGYRITRRP